jgi:hypothetical protein
MNKDYAHVSYTNGCDYYSTIVLKIPPGPKIHCVIHICDACLPKYQLDDSDMVQPQHLFAVREDNGSGAAK